MSYLNENSTLKSFQKIGAVESKLGTETFCMHGLLKFLHTRFLTGETRCDLPDFQVFTSPMFAPFVGGCAEDAGAG